MKNILVTGGHGFIASHTIEELKKRGYKVVTNVRSIKAVEDDYLKDVDRYLIDNRDSVGMRSIIEKIDGVINLAGILGTKSVDNSQTFYENNVKAAVGIFGACVEYNVPIVQITVGNYFEFNDYSNSKVLAERELIKFARFKGLRGNCVRGLNAFGERQKIRNTGKIIPTFIYNALNSLPIKVYGGKDNCGVMDMIYVKDLAKILVDVLEQTEAVNNYGNVYEAGSGVGMPVFQIAELVKSFTKSVSVIVEVPMRSGESKSSVVVAQNPYTNELTDFKTALKRTIKYYEGLN